MEISVSLYASNQPSLSLLVRELDQFEVDYFHIDCLENLSVFDDIAAIRQVSSTPIDLHIIAADPAPFLELAAAHQVEMVTIQYENLAEKTIPKTAYSGRLGLALSSETAITEFERFQESCSFVLLMTTTPGVSGGSFNKENFRKIRLFRRAYRGVQIHVDGGVNAEVGFILRNLGISLVVSGSYLFGSRSLGAALFRLKAGENHSHFRIEDFMMTLEETPVLNSQNLQLREVLQKIEDFGMGFCSIVDEQGRLSGFISNADVRRGLLKHAPDFNRLTAEEIINPRPVFIYGDQTVVEMLQLVKSLPFPVLYLPVINRNRQLTGAIKFNNLIKGES